MLILIAAMSRNRVIGRNNVLPWRLPCDLKRFRCLTMGHPVVMGRLTYESIGRPLDGRTNIVISRQARQYPDCLLAHSLDEALATAKNVPGGKQIFCIGGEQIFRQALPLADELDLTLVDEETEGDAFFPEIYANDWRMMSYEPVPANAITGLPRLTYRVFRRKVG